MLVVDDEQDILKSLKRLFRRDFNVTLANSGEEALTCIKDKGTRCFDIILTDQRMTGIQGADLLKEVYGLCGETASILVTGYVDMPSLIKAINEGRVYGYMGKPWEPEQLKKMVYDSIKRLNTIKFMSSSKTDNRYNTEKAAYLQIKPHNQLLSYIKSCECSNKFTNEELLSLWQIAINTLIMDISMTSLSLWFDLSRNNRTINYKTLDISILIEKICADFSVFTEQKGLSLFVEVIKNCQVNVDPEIITQTILILLSNALKYTYTSGNITIRTIEYENNICIEIQDTGVGIDSDLIEKILNQKKPEIKAGTSNEISSGQGLIIANEFLKIHQTSLQIKSKIDSGSTLSFNILKKT